MTQAKQIIYRGCNKAYPFYVVNRVMIEINPRKILAGAVVSGWEFRSDAQDDLDERPDRDNYEVMSASRLHEIVDSLSDTAFKRNNLRLS